MLICFVACLVYINDHKLYVQTATRLVDMKNIALILRYLKAVVSIQFAWKISRIFTVRNLISKIYNFCKISGIQFRISVLIFSSELLRLGYSIKTYFLVNPKERNRMG